MAERIIRKIAETGTNLIVVGGTIAELMLHYAEKYKLMIVRVTSKFELKRICKAVGATPIARLDAPTPEEIGECDEVRVEEIGSQKVTVFLKDNDECKLNTIVLRGSTTNLLDDI
jgi:T-complex protein 1 subunit theta